MALNRNIISCQGLSSRTCEVPSPFQTRKMQPQPALRRVFPIDLASQTCPQRGSSSSPAATHNEGAARRACLSQFPVLHRSTCLKVGSSPACMSWDHAHTPADSLLCLSRWPVHRGNSCQLRRRRRCHRTQAASRRETGRGHSARPSQDDRQ